MRIFKQALASMAILVLALVALNLVRLGQVPAQVGPPVALRNGDVDCDGQINISDPLVLLNWLFGTGQEPCAIAQTDACCTELRAEVAKLAARVPGPRDLVAFTAVSKWQNSRHQPFYKVPEDRWFVLTELLFIGASAPVPDLVKITEQEQSKVDTPPVRGLQLAGSAYTWSSGISFPPGTELALTNPIGPGDISLYITGHLTGE